MLSETNLDYFAGIFVFNPLDDEFHLERISNNISSICEAASHTNLKIKITVCQNTATVKNDLNLELIGVGPQTQLLIQNLQNKYKFEIINQNLINAISKGYNHLLKHGHQTTDAKKIVVFADDYIMPIKWFDWMEENFKLIPNASFMMPVTCFVSQEALNCNIPYHPEWDVRVAEKGDHSRWNYKTIFGGVKIEHVEHLANFYRNENIIPYFDPPSFETTVFTRELIDKVGYICDEYFSCYFDSDYFKLIESNNLNGYIAKNIFIFHYGKGGTKALYRETNDEKYKESPVYNQVVSDIDTWNRRWNQKASFTWGTKNN